MTTTTTTRAVIVRDNAAEAAAWGTPGPTRIITREITLNWVCPVCGGPRGEVRGHNFYSDGDWGHVNVWDNPCGHVDMYENVIVEAARG